MADCSITLDGSVIPSFLSVAHCICIWEWARLDVRKGAAPFCCSQPVLSIWMGHSFIPYCCVHYCIWEWVGDFRAEKRGGTLFGFLEWLCFPSAWMGHGPFLHSLIVCTASRWFGSSEWRDGTILLPLGCMYVVLLLLITIACFGFGQFSTYFLNANEVWITWLAAAVPLPKP
jgi:hypothetical protein